jgi:hypothetical protein
MSTLNTAIVTVTALSIVWYTFQFYEKLKRVRTL